MKKGSRILIVDDELMPDEEEPGGSYMWYYSRALRDAKYAVVEVVGPDSALDVLSSGKKPFDLVIIDVMMPPGKAYAKDNTLDGLRTGVLLAKTINADYPSQKIVVLTNVLNPEVKVQLGQCENIVKVLSKPECTPFELRDLINEL